MKNFRAIKPILLLIMMLGLLNHSNAAFFSSKTEKKGINLSIPQPTDTLPKKKDKAPMLYSSSNTGKSRSNTRITFETFQQNLEKAKRFYDKKQFLSAAKYFEELYPLSLGQPVADTILFLFADCYFQNKDYQMAAFHFKDYTRRYPGTTRTELAYLKCLQSIYNLSPVYSLDQYETKYAIEEINLFIQLYPKSSYMEECNTMLDELRNKLAHKDFEQIKLYYNTENYKATQIAAKNFSKDYTYSTYSDDALFILIKNNYEYARKSVETKKYERFMECVDAYDKLCIHHPDSPFLAEAKKVADDAGKQIEKIKNRKNKNQNI
ncbi:MAG: outer membrane protein assembly factor BamD [Bacteroidales bacterium]|nr:outer membrane protein assembly factor BamD [Bacteroidales bacterium]